MMNWLFYTVEESNKAVVNLVYYVEPDNLDMYDGYIVVDKLEEAEEKAGYSAILYCSPNTSEYWYEYEERELTQEEEVENLKQLVADLAEITIMGAL